MQAVTITQITYEEFEKLIENSIRKIFAEINLHEKTNDEPKFFDLNELIKYHPGKPAAATVYGWIAKNKIPFHKNGNKVFFLKEEIDAWLLGDGNFDVQKYIDEMADAALVIKRPKNKTAKQYARDAKNKRDKMHDPYIAQLLSSQAKEKIDFDSIPKELIDVKRSSILLKREIKNKTK